MKPHRIRNCYDFKINDPAGKQPSLSNFPQYFTLGRRDLRISQIAGIYPQSREAKRSLAKRGKVQAMLGILLHPEHGGVTPSPCPMEPRLQTDTQEVFRYIPHCSFVLCLLPGSRTATVSMVSARPIPVPGCETT